MTTDGIDTPQIAFNGFQLSCLNTGQRFKLDRETLIGRADGCRVKLDRPSVQPRHARITSTDDGILLENLSTSDDIFLNGCRIESEAWITLGDEIYLDGVIFLIEMESASQEYFPNEPSAGAQLGSQNDDASTNSNAANYSHDVTGGLAIVSDAYFNDTQKPPAQPKTIPSQRAHEPSEPSRTSEPPGPSEPSGPSLPPLEDILAEASTNMKTTVRIPEELETSPESTTGFAKAKKLAHSALNANKMVLNKRFVLESVIGVGGMGKVYLAKDLRKIEADDLNPHVAVKVLNEEFKKHPSAFIALQREASRSHLLSHPNIITVHDFDRDGDFIFMTMEFLDGQSLGSLLKKHPTGLPELQAQSILNGVAAGLIHAHEKGFIHSDLKPGNIFVSNDGKVKLLDFGIARSLSQQNNDFDAGTLLAITPAYATLEMFANMEPSPEDDIYALGVIAYQLFSGVHPFERNSIEDAMRLALKPKTLSCLTRRQMKSLNHALQFEKQHRAKTVSEFIAAFLPKKKKLLPLF